MDKYKAHILVVDDDDGIRSLVKKYLNENQFLVTTAESAEDAYEKIKIIKFDLIVLDIMMPGKNGLEFIQDNKKKLETPIILLTAKGEANERVEGLEIGADDYVSKPFSVVELMARINAQLRRHSAALAGEKLTYMDIELHSDTHRVFRNGTEVKLGPTEYRLLSFFMERPGRVRSREQLLDHVWGREIYVESRTVDVHIGRLRKALTKNGGDDPIRTVRGSGYSIG